MCLRSKTSSGRHCRTILFQYCLRPNFVVSMKEKCNKNSVTLSGDFNKSLFEMFLLLNVCLYRFVCARMRVCLCACALCRYCLEAIFIMLYGKDYSSMTNNEVSALAIHPCLWIHWNMFFTWNFWWGKIYKFYFLLLWNSIRYIKWIYVMSFSLYRYIILHSSILLISPILFVITNYIKSDVDFLNSLEFYDYVIYGCSLINSVLYRWVWCVAYLGDCRILIPPNGSIANLVICWKIMNQSGAIRDTKLGDHVPHEHVSKDWRCRRFSSFFKVFRFLSYD